MTFGGVLPSFLLLGGVQESFVNFGMQAIKIVFGPLSVASLRQSDLDSKQEALCKHSKEKNSASGHLSCPTV